MSEIAIAEPEATDQAVTEVPQPDLTPGMTLGEYEVALA